jgi:hypothetical protein
LAHEPISAFLSDGFTPTVYWLPLREHGKYLADPFAIRQDNTLHILCEEFDYRTDKNRIVAIDLDLERPISCAKTEIELPVNGSYPYLVEHRGEIYCVPETYQAREIGLYKAEEFPHHWRKVVTLVDDFPGIDPTVFRYGKYWWLACTEKGPGSWSDLHIWHAPDLFGPWMPHSANPVKRDIRSSRPAGTPFVHDGVLYRPAQDCSRTYGGQVVVNRVLRLTPSEFKEEQAATVHPNADGPYPDGLHTLSSCNGHTFLDGKRLRFFRSAFKRRVRLACEKTLCRTGK